MRADNEDRNLYREETERAEETRRRTGESMDAGEGEGQWTKRYVEQLDGRPTYSERCPLDGRRASFFDLTPGIVRGPTQGPARRAPHSSNHRTAASIVTENLSLTSSLRPFADECFSIKLLATVLTCRLSFFNSNLTLLTSTCRTDASPLCCRSYGSRES